MWPKITFKTVQEFPTVSLDLTPFLFSCRSIDQQRWLIESVVSLPEIAAAWEARRPDTGRSERIRDSKLIWLADRYWPFRSRRHDQGTAKEPKEKKRMARNVNESWLKCGLGTTVGFQAQSWPLAIFSLRATTVAHRPDFWKAYAMASSVGVWLLACPQHRMSKPAVKTAVKVVILRIARWFTHLPY